ncbi:hypothetical protein A5630_11720 [Mycolicibacterium mucogenicum]|uniref:AMP-dependent synthetase/ligase domain-containing protein n=2 Tax=Mycolicibacterium mucogenicum TaxID=56689 RepID=A0A1A3HFC7_MYCMU|nr:hypothetical protein A5630_11720 [Mycolicibacterium mucogenicum]
MLSAYGTAAAAALGPRDTVYCLAPAYHPSGLLVAMGGAIAAGSRFAMTDGFAADAFWDEVRRYGVTVGVYTWTMLRQLIDAAPNSAEVAHPIRLFVGSGMPPALWRNVLRRFAPAKVVEFYTAADAEVVLVNLGDQKIGSLGRPLPGSAKAIVTAWDTERSRPELDAAGLARKCRPDEVGMLLVAVDPLDPSTGQVPALRALFEPDDAWVVTGDLVRRDHDGDFWLIGDAPALIRTPRGARSPKAIADALESLDGIELAVAYAGEWRGEPAAVAAAVLTDDANVDSLAKEIAALRFDDRPDIVHIVDDIPMTDWFRLETTGLPTAEGGTPERRLIILPHNEIPPGSASVTVTSNSTV